MEETAKTLQVESTEAFRKCFQVQEDPAFRRYIGKARRLHELSETSPLHLRMKKERRLLPEFEKLFIVPKEFLKFSPMPDFDPRSPQNVLIVDHRNILLMNLDLLSYFNRKDDNVQSAILHKLRRMVYWRVKNKTSEEARREIDRLYMKIRTFLPLTKEDLDLFSRIMANHYWERTSDIS